MAFEVPPYVVERLSKPYVKPKTIRIDRDRIYVTYEERVHDREPVDWAGVDMNAGNNTYACADGRVMVVPNDHVRQYNRACSSILRVKRRGGQGDRRVVKKFQTRGWKKYTDCICDSTRKEARRIASAGYGLGYEELNIHRLYTKNGRMASFMRGRQKTTLNTGQRRRALINAVESEGLPHVGVDPAGTSADCLKCGGKLKRSGAPSARNERNMWCQPCRMIRERDANAGANILFRAIWQLLEDAGHIGAAGGGRRQCRFRGAA